MSQQLAFKGGNELEVNISTVFGEKIKGLSTEPQEIRLNDMVTAFGNSLIVLKRAEVI